MPYAKLDHIFPYIVFFYGVFVVFVTELGLTKINLKKSLSSPRLHAVAQGSIHQLESHLPIAWVCFWLGGLWSLQNLLFS
jgi:hypothetical protein